MGVFHKTTRIRTIRKAPYYGGLSVYTRMVSACIENYQNMVTPTPRSFKLNARGVFTKWMC